VHVGPPRTVDACEATGAFRAAFTLVRLLYTNDGTTARHAVACTIAPAPDSNQMEPNVIDRLREQIQERLDQLAGEADRLRKALAALDPRSSKAPAGKPPVREPAQRSPSKPTASATKSAPARRTSQPAARSPRRTAPGATKASVLAALAGGEAMTAGQVAAKAGLARGTVSTTLSKLAKSGEVQKAERGYRLAPAAGSSAPSPAQ
jgi:CRP-like cAMP-binding protein